MYNLHSPTKKNKNKYKVEWKLFRINRLFWGKGPIDPREGRLFCIIYWKKLLYDYLWPPLNKTRAYIKLYGLKLIIETKQLIIKNDVIMILNYIFIETNNYLFIITWMPQNSYTDIIFCFAVGTASKTEVLSRIPIKINVLEIIVSYFLHRWWKVWTVINCVINHCIKAIRFPGKYCSAEVWRDSICLHSKDEWFL